MEIGPDVSVVVATYNRRAGLAELLQALAAQSYPASQFEVVVVDDGSTDGTPGLLATMSVPYTLRSWRQANGGPAAARNLGMQHARGQLILFLDDDVVPEPHLIDAHVRAHGDGADRVVTGPMSPPPLDWPQPTWDRWDARQLEKQYRAMLAGEFECSQRQFFTANASVRRDVILAAGGFDPTFRRAEDMELAWRMSRLGVQFIFEPEAEVVHYAARPFVSWCRNAYQYGRFDVVMEREKAIPVFGIACSEFHDRRAVNRWLARLCVGRPLIRDATLLALALTVHASERISSERVASFALSSIFNVRYWQGASDELGGASRLWKAIAARGAPSLVEGLRLVERDAEGASAYALTRPAAPDAGNHPAARALGSQP
jgi:GT2 family glycosyltransferase